MARGDEQIRGHSRRRVLWRAGGGAVAGAAGLAALGGCAPGAPAPAADRASGDVVIGLGGGTPEQVKSTEETVARFQERYPQIKVSAEHLFGGGTALPTAFQARRAGGTLPGLIGRVGDNVGLPWAFQGAMAPLDPFLKNDRTIKLEDMASIESFRLGGKLWGISSEPNVVLLFVNKTHLQKNGIPLPSNDWSIDEFVDLATRANTATRDTTSPVWGYDYARRWSLFMGWLSMWGGSMTIKERSRFSMNAPESVQALSWDADLIYRYRVGPPPKGATGDFLGTNLPGAVFEEGSVALTLTGINSAVSYRQKIADKFSWDLIAVPKGPKGRGNTVAGVGWMMTKDAKAPDAAWELMKTLAGEDGQATLSRNSSLFPSMRKLWPDFMKVTGAQNLQALTLAADTLAVNFPVTPSFGTWTGEVLAPALTAVWENKQSARDAMSSVTGQIDAMLAEDAKNARLG